MSFEQLATKYRLPKQDFWKYLQLRSCIMSAQQKLPLSPQTELQRLMQDNQGAGGGASRYYSLIRQSHPPKLEGLESMGGGYTGRDSYGEVGGNYQILT